MEKAYSKDGDLTIEELGFDIEQLAENHLDFLACEGARVILSVALNEEVTRFLGRSRYERNPDASKGHRNGSRRRTYYCGSGEVAVDVPRIRDTEKPFQSRIISRWQKVSNKILQIVPLLYLEGLSTRDFRRALAPLFGGKSLSRSSVSRINVELKEQFAAWRKRDLSGEDVIYLFLDGVYMGVYKGRREKEAILVAHGVRRDGKRVLLSVMLGGKESSDSWKSLIHDLIDRGLKMPQLVISDGNKGLIRAVRDIWPSAARQRCTKHRTANILARIPKKRQEEVKNAAHGIFYANSEDEAVEAAKRFSERYRDEFPEACKILGTDLEDCLTYFRFPPRHWKRIRTSNVIERAFREVRRRTNVVGRFPTPMSALVVVWGVMEEDRIKWRGLHMDDKHQRMIEAAVIELKNKPIEVKGFEWLEAA